MTATSHKIFAIADIHGEFDRLSRLMDYLPFNHGRGDRLVFVGDYINRGKQTAEVITYLIALKKRFPNTVFLMGNHEHTLLSYAKTQDEQLLTLLRHMKVEEMLKSYGRDSPKSLSDLSFLPADHLEFLNHLDPYIRIDDYLFVHAGLIPGKKPEDHTLESLVGIRNIFHDSDEENREFTMVFGHIPFEMPLVTPKSIGIDTGASYGNMLTAVELPAVRFYHA